LKCFAKVFSLGAPEESVAEQGQGYKEQNQPLAKNYPLLSHIERQMLPSAIRGLTVSLPRYI